MSRDELRSGAGSLTPRPLPVDPGELACIRPMAPGHLPDVCRLHRAAMGRSLWALLGEGFLRRLYGALLGHPDFVGFVYRDPEAGRVRGFIAGTVHGPRLFRQTLLRHGPGLGLAALSGLLRHPGALWPLLQTARYFGASGVPGAEAITAESFFCSFEPGVRGKRISGLINKVLFDALLARGQRRVKITTEADNRGAVRQLTSWGFERLGEFSFYGKRMVTWRLDLEQSPRVDGSTAGLNPPAAGLEF